MTCEQGLEKVLEAAEQFVATPLHPKEDPRKSYAAAQKAIMRALLKFYQGVQR